MLLLACAMEEPVDTGCAHEPELTWANFGEPFMIQYCNGCHATTQPEALREGAPLSVNFDSYSGVLAQAERIVARAVPADATMPPGGGPSAEERALLGEWLGCAVAADAAELEAQ